MNDELREQLADATIDEWIGLALVIMIDLFGIPLFINFIVNGWQVLDWGLITIVFVINTVITMVGLIRVLNDPDLLDED